MTTDPSSSDFSSTDAVPGDPTPPQGTSLIPRRSGVAFELKAGQTVTVIDPLGRQVSDLLAFNLHDLREALSSGRTIDYNSRIYLTTPDPLYSNRSNVMLRITHDTVGRHDFLFTPCSAETFRIKFGDETPHRGCFGNLVAALEPWGVSEEMVTVPFNCFMNVPMGEDGVIRVLPPVTKAGDCVTFTAEMDLLVGLTACSALRSNGGCFKPIWYRIE